MQVYRVLHYHHSHEDASGATDAADVFSYSNLSSLLLRELLRECNGPATVLLITKATASTSSTAGRALVVVHVSYFETPTLDFSVYAL